MRTTKILTGIVGGVAVLAVATPLAVWFLVDPNAYQAKLAALIRESTGRELNLTGALKLSIFPRIALRLGPASLGNPPGFGGEPFLTFRRADVRVKLWPLLHQRLELAGVEVEGLDVRLRQNAQGHVNWQNTAHLSEPARSLEASDAADSGHSLRNLAGIRVVDGRVSYREVVIDGLQLQIGVFTDAGVVPVTAAFDADLGSPDAHPGVHASVNAKFALSTDSAGAEVRVAALSLSGLASRPGSNQPTHWEFSAPTIDVNLAQHAIEAPAFALRYLGAQMNGKLEARRIAAAGGGDTGGNDARANDPGENDANGNDARGAKAGGADEWAVNGSLTVAPLVLREFLPRIGVRVTRIQDPHALSEFSASSDFAYDAAGVHLSKFQAHVDDTQIHGSLALSTQVPRSVQFDLAADQIDADRYFKPTRGPGDLPGAAEQAGAAAAPTDRAPNTGGVNANWLSDGATPMDADGTLSVGSLHIAHLDLTNAKVTIAAKDDVIHLFPAQALLDGGRYSGDITYDRRGDIPKLSLDEHLAEVDMRRLLGDAGGGNRLSGRGSVSLKASAQGNGADSMLKSLNGHLVASLADGAIEGVDLSHEFGIAQALFTRTPASTREDTGRTQFDTFRMSADIANGVATTKDLTISSPALRVTGEGSTNLSSKAVNFQLLASISTPTAKIANIPLRVTGTYADPKVRPDLDKLVKGELKQRLQDVLHDKLQGLFGKP